MSRPRAEFALPDARAARRGFDRAARSFDTASVVHDLTRERLLDRLDFVRLDPRTILDLGCATGRGAARLASRYPGARVFAIDGSLPMLQAARRAGSGPRGVTPLLADAEKLPFPDGKVDLIFANMLLPWAPPQLVFPEAARVLSEGGLLLFATLGPDTLEQVRRAWAAVDDGVHVHASFEMHDLGDLATASGLAEPVVDVDRITVTYRDVDSMVRDLRSIGATNVAAGRRRALTGRRRWDGFVRALEAARRDERIPVTVELVLGQGWGTGGGARRRTDAGETSVPISEVGIMRRSRR
ncbi:MAG: methyltransferase domain-containing protein [Gammaproteobacteria bacterium]|nr:methyltransferase domain-containing protein [Gammaproteobacteria bacterium]